MRLLISFLFFILVIPVFSQSFTIEGVVKDSVTGEAMPGTSVYTSDQKAGGFTDDNGKFFFTLPAGNYEIIAEFFGYKKFSRRVNLQSNTSITIDLAPETSKIKEIVLTGKRENENVQETKVSTIALDVEQIKKLPALFGEVDVMKSLQLLPGVQVAGEGNTGLYVRGGGPDQNLVLIDNATVYNPVHSVGIFSVFNSDVLGSAELYKGGIPAAYGGRLSSLVDIQTKTGNKEKFGVNGGIGLLSSRLMVEGPIVKDKSSFFISGRRTYFDLFLRLSGDEGIRNTRLYFYDLNGKVSLRLNEKNFLDISGYYGEDVLKLAGILTNDYGNTATSVAWKHIFSEKLYSKTILTYSAFDYNIRVDMDAQQLKINNGISDVGLKQIFNYDLNSKNNITAGFDISYKTYYPGSLEPNAPNSIFLPFRVPNMYSLDEGIFVSNKQEITKRLTADYGLRFSIFSQIGPAEVYSYEGDLINEKIIDTTVYDKFDFIKTYTGLEPRVSLRYTLTESSSIKASYNRMYQYLHLLSNTTAPIPSNIWIPSTTYIKPQRADQVAGGYFRNFKDNMFETSVEVYYKDMTNVIDFIDDAEVTLNKTPETEVLAGKSWAYGAEFFIRKQKGKTTGWISYTLSKVQRKIEGINENRIYPASYDRPHNLNVVVSHDISKRVNLSGTFVYGSGRPFTLPAAKYNFDYFTASYYTSRNGYRLKDYHRLDLAVNIDFNQSGKFKSSLNISLYNAYGRKNPYTVIVRDAEDEGTGGKELAMIYLFRWLPSITYNFSF